jgi:hypothetical protein
MARVPQILVQDLRVGLGEQPPVCPTLCARAKAGAEAVTRVCHDLSEPLPLRSQAFDRVLCGFVGAHSADLG